MGKGPVSKKTRGLPPLVRALAFGCILLALLLCTQEVLAPKGGCIEEVERFAFYERARHAYAIVSTSETALYANIILKKGVVTD